MAEPIAPGTRLGLIPGECAGVGPELCVHLAHAGLSDALLALGDGDLLLEAAAALGKTLTLLPPDAPHVEPGQLRILHRPRAVPSRFGHLDAGNSAHVHSVLLEAAHLAASGQLDGLVTGPVHKGILNQAGIAYTGTTELLAREAGCEVVMMLASARLRVALATTHLPLRAVPDALTPDLLRRVLQITLQDLQEKFGLARPVLKVCGLNPHAGEGGHLGREELEVIEPVLAEFRAAGHAVGHALPADTLFTAQGLGGADAVLAMYHDQGLPVLKSQGFGEAINITLGLPFIRTSVDHGTALSLAGTGHAQSGSLQRALEVALELVQRQNVRTAPHGEVQS